MSAWGTDTDPTGGTRYSEGKPSAVDLPLLGIAEVARVGAYGGQKYAPRDWERGQSMRSLLGSAFRHLSRAMLDPWSRDPESGCLHLGHAAWNLLAALHFFEAGRVAEVDDISGWIGVAAADRSEAEARIRKTMSVAVGNRKG